MTRIRFKVLRGTMALFVAILLLLVGHVTADLEFYEGAQAQLSPQAKLERLVRLLSMHQRQQEEGPRHAIAQRNHKPSHSLDQLEKLEKLQELQEMNERLDELRRVREEEQREQEERWSHQQQQQVHHQQHLMNLAMQKQRGMLRDDLPERPNIIDALQRESADPLEYVRELERQRLLPYLEYVPPKGRDREYSVEDELRARLIPGHLNKDPMLDYPETHYADLERARQFENSRRLENSHKPIKQFTFHFDEPAPYDENSPRPFAVKPNDPRYWEESVTEKEKYDSASSNEREQPLQRQDFPVHQENRSNDPTQHHHHHYEAQRQQNPMTNAQNKQSEVSIFKVGERLPKNGANVVVEGDDDAVLPEPQRRAEVEPRMVSMKATKQKDDIIFIAIVAGCSAVAMFALVLISLTWCRLQRVSKAAADVEYPAYGVTGPNKDMSPSGDQRLAQSAQMYHFQHQKQQIIAMEKASASRDQGSVSDPESDEENEEGDYTVYECPGLAPTGEMEVKNPLFHDDPTPATPGKSSKKHNDDV